MKTRNMGIKWAIGSIQEARSKQANSTTSGNEELACSTLKLLLRT
jgi:hypothetical protein